MSASGAAIVMVAFMVEFNVIRASILEGWLFHPYGRTSRFGAESPAPLYYRSSNDFAITYGCEVKCLLDIIGSTKKDTTH